MNRSIMMVVGCAVAALVSQANSANANDLALDFSSVTEDYTNGSWSLGWEFSVNADIVVTELGFYDDLMDGLVESHDVGIFDVAGNLLVSGTVDPDDPLASWWRFVAVPDTELSAGENYVIAAVTLTEKYTWNPLEFITAEQITFVSDRWVGETTALAFPTESYGDGIAFFGPNFSFVPAPGGIVLLLLAGGNRRTQPADASGDIVGFDTSITFRPMSR